MHITGYKKINNTVNKKQQGFTLIEIIVAVSIFALVMTMAVGAILSIVGANKKANALNSVVTSLNGAFESMVRDLRTGYKYDCTGARPNPSPNDCTTGHESISFISSQENGKAVSYALVSNRIVKYIDSDRVGEITPPEVIITNLNFYVSGAGVGDGKQARVLITLRGYSGLNPRTKSEFNLQTLVTQRQLDI